MNLTRRGFIGGGAALCAVGGRASASAANASVGYDAVQKEIDALPKEAFLDFVYGENMSANRSGLSSSECETWYDWYPILRRYDEAFRKVAREMRETKVEGDTPAVWFVYNMGVIVKTRKSLFSIDLCHRLAPTIADELGTVSPRMR